MIEFGATVKVTEAVFELAGFVKTTFKRDPAPALPQEEPEKHYRSAKELVAELGVVDDRTAEEKESERRACHEEMLFNQARIYKALRE